MLQDQTKVLLLPFIRGEGRDEGLLVDPRIGGMLFALSLLFALLSLPSTFAAPAPSPREAVRSACVEGRRIICGKVLEVLPEGLVVDSGYTNLLRPPLTQSWVAPATVNASRNPNAIEGKEPGCVAFGLVFLTDLPRNPKPHAFDYVMLTAYPAGQHSYTSTAGIRRTVRRFAGGVETAVRLTFQQRPYGLEQRPQSKAYLSMPPTAGGTTPKLLSETGAFLEARNLKPSPALTPYDLAVPFWSDGAGKSRWLAVPNDAASGMQKIKFTASGEWTFPKGTVFVKHFEIATNELRPELQRRLETRLLVCDSTGSVYGVTYKWRADNSDADLLATTLVEPIQIQTVRGVRTQNWFYPSRQDCRTCHTDRAGGVLGVKTRQLNHDFAYPSGTTDNQLRALNHAGFFEAGCDENELEGYAALARPDDPARSLEDRARSYLDANCAHCHRPGGTVANFDARWDTPLPQQNLLNGPILIDEGLDNARAIAPNDIWRSVMFLRINTLEGLKMPPLAHQILDKQSLALMKQWIESLPGPPVLAPPSIAPKGGNFPKVVEVTLAHPEPGAVLHYTLDGSAPTKSDPVYDQPIRLTESTVLRTRAFKPGFTKSITAQQVFVVGD
jgi:uncharacterized repeat protein (TIGR03806 family)